jgi:5-methylcytosine-specific restriction endonuclease McrA
MVSRYLTKEQKVESRARASNEKLCRWCGLDVKRLSTRRSTFCSDDCVHEFRIRTDSSYIRHYIAQRDKHTCQICGLDCKGFLRKLWRFVNEAKSSGTYSSTPWRERQKALEYEFFTSLGMEWVNTHCRSTFYDIDHINPVVEGGHQCGEENLRLLCLGCHRKETAELRKRLASKPEEK